MKFPFLRKKFKSLDIAFALFIWMFWGFLERAYLSGELYLRGIEIIREDRPLLFWPLFCVLAIAFLCFTYGFLFKELPSRAPEYDHHGNIDTKS